jgi:nucleoside-diphosphate-sugar epimerase
MRIFVAGATGAVGQRLVPMLVARGHEVAGTTRTPQKQDLLRELGAQPMVVDALDAGATRAAVARFAPEVVIHQLTAVTANSNPRRFDDWFAPTNRLRTAGTDNLVAAARAAGVRRLVAQSFGGWPYARTGGPVKTESDPLDPTPAGNARQTLAAIRHLEEAVLAPSEVEGVVLRYGLLYGPGNGIGRGGEMVTMIEKRRFPVVGAGTGVWSFLHIDDAAGAAVAAAERGPAGVYNIADDEPAQVRTWLPWLARVLGAKPPRQVPAWLARPLLGEQVMNSMLSVRGIDSSRAHRDLDWKPGYPTWREGFRTGLG